jgi:RNA polymerase sigma-70 factor (ECF subfamily)
LDGKEMNADYEVTAGDGHRPAVDEPSDSVLLWRFRDGSQEAARHLYHRYARRLLALARTRCTPGPGQHVDADDIVQGVFATFFDGVSRGRYDVPDGEDLWKLFLVLALNKIRSEGVFHRAAKRDSRMTLALDRLPPSARLSRRQRATADGYLRLVVEEALQRLPPQHRQIVEKRIEGHEVAAIARQIGRSKRSVERILQESRNKLSFLLQDR